VRRQQRAQKRWHLTDSSSPPSSDADPDVLAEYVLAILKSDVPDAEIRAQMLEHLPDFLNERKILPIQQLAVR
jgi:hypothetical protein